MGKFVQDQERYRYLEDIIEDELSSNTRITIEALLWLKRYALN